MTRAGDYDNTIPKGPMTQVEVVSAQNIPEGSVLSFRVGGFRRQRPYNRLSGPFLFHGAPTVARPLQVDVLAPIATSGDLAVLGVGEHEVTFQQVSPKPKPTPSPSPSPSLAEPPRPLNPAPDPTQQQQQPVFPPTNGGGGGAVGSDAVLKEGSEASTSSISITLRIAEVLTDLVLRDASSETTERPGTAAKVQSYMESHSLKDHLTHAMMTVMREQPEDPMGFLSSLFWKGGQGRRGSRPDLRPPSRGSGVGGGGTVPQVQVRDSMHVLPPCVSIGEPTRLLDFGSGETGFNIYSMGPKGENFTFKGNKRKAPFFPAFVEPGCVEAFVDALMDEFELASCAQAQVSIFAGATGLHRELLGNVGNAAKANDFLDQAEKELSTRLGGKPARIFLFVPSGLLEAQFELFATEWLVGRSSLLDLSAGTAAESVLTESLILQAFNQMDKSGNGTLNKEDLDMMAAGHDEAEGKPGSKKRQVVHSAMSELVERGGQLDFSQFHESLKCSVSLQMAVQTLMFSGTLSAGGGSSQLAMMGPSYSSTVQLFSVPVGNRVPIVEGLFSKPVLEAERQNWALRIQSELRQARFPCGIRGLFVGISAAYYAMKEAGVSDEVISLGTALNALESALKNVDANDDRTIANLTLVYEIVKWCFDPSAYFVFKRQWKTRDGEFVSTWTLGLFTQQHEARRAQEVKSRPKRKVDIWKLAASRVVQHRSLPASRELQENNKLWMMDNLFEVPFVAWPLHRTHMLDLGSGEVGLYLFEADLVNKMVLARGDRKLSEAFYEGFVSSGRVLDFANILVSEFNLGPDRTRTREIIAGGATGLHREMLVSDQKKRDEIFRFIADVEEQVSTLIGRDTCIRLFVPSGELEAQFELRAVQWLIGVSGMDIETGVLPDWMVNQAWRVVSSSTNQRRDFIDVAVAKDKLSSIGLSEEEVNSVLARADANHDQRLAYQEFVAAAVVEPTFQALIRRCTFCGTISAGGGSSQLTLTSYFRNSLPQLFSMPVGNGVPKHQMLFSEEVTWQQRSDWIERIRAGLRTSQFPRGLSGFFVGISAMYHAAKASSIADRLVTKREAVAALASTLAKIDVTDHRTIANLTLVKEILSWVFSDETTVLLFKRNWSTSSATYVAGWTLGLYCTQFENDDEVRTRSVVTIQKSERGRQVRVRAAGRR